jgi:thiol:disulfide interchange protein DsbA
VTRTHSLALAKAFAKSLAIVLAAVLVSVSPPLRAAVVEGQDFRKLDPVQPTESPGKIEVIEFFSWGCPHCNEFYPLVTAWAAKLPKDVVFKRVATGFGRTAWTNLAKTYYALEATGDLSRLEGAIFHAIHEERAPLFDQKSISEWVGKHGVDTEKFSAAFASFSVNTKLIQAEQMVERYHVEGIPAVAVNGRYVVVADSFQQMLTNTDQVIAKVRSETAAAAANHR